MQDDFEEEMAPASKEQQQGEQPSFSPGGVRLGGASPALGPAPVYRWVPRGGVWSGVPVGGSGGPFRISAACAFACFAS